jgi:DNA-binding LytR/AlgR family response regulator
MEAMLMRLDDRIYRCHHSLAVNMDAIRSISRDTIELIDGSTITMCRSATSRAKKAWLDYISR